MPPPRLMRAEALRQHRLRGEDSVWLLPHKPPGSPQVTCKPCWQSVSCTGQAAPLLPQNTDWTQALKQPCWQKAQSSLGIWSTPLKERSERGETRTWPSHGPVQGQGPHPRWHPQSQAPEWAKRISQEALNTQPRGPGSEGSTGLGRGWCQSLET